MGVNDAGMNIISNMGVKTQGDNGTCHNVEVDLDRCSAYLDGDLLNTTAPVSVNGITIVIRRQRVRVSVPNCDRNKKLTMWMICTKRNSEDMLELVVARGDGLEPTAHGLIGMCSTPLGSTSIRSWNVVIDHNKIDVEFFVCTFIGPVFALTTMYPSPLLQVSFGTSPWILQRTLVYMLVAW